MEMTEGARNRCRASLRRRNALIPWFTPYCLPITIGKVAALAFPEEVVEWAGAAAAFRVEVFREVAGPAAEAAAADAIRRNLTWMARKFWIGFPKKPAAGSTQA